MAATQFFISLLSLSDNLRAQASLIHITIFTSFIFVLVLTLLLLIFTLYVILKNNDGSCVGEKERHIIKIKSLPLNDAGNSALHQGEETASKPVPENFGLSLLVEIVPSDSAKWETPLGKSKDFDDFSNEKNGSILKESKKKRKKRVKNKTPDSTEQVIKERDKLVCSYPFTKSCSATQRKIKQQYDQLVKSHGSKGLTLDQIGQFVNCLIEAKNELQHKSEVLKRRFTITKALLFKADRSTFVRLRQQIYKLELEQKRLDEDTLVYNWLQEQLKVSPAYKKMLEIGACMEMEAKSSSQEENADDEFSDMSFEELLEQEKKDAFWQRNGRLKS